MKLFDFLILLTFSSINGINYCEELSPSPLNESTSFILNNYQICAPNIPINYNLCLNLLKRSDKCNGLIYSNARCIIYNRFHKIKARRRRFLEITSQNHSRLHFIRLVKYIDQCTENAQERSDLNDMEICLNDKTTKLYQNSPSWNAWMNLPPLGIVMAVTNDWMTSNKYEMDRIIDNWKCYAETHNYIFHLHVMENMSRNRFYHLRHPSITSQYLHKYRYLLILDADNLVVNISRSLDSLISPPKSPNDRDVTDLFFHMREGGEVTASTYIIRNSFYSRCFISYWRSLAPSDDLQPHGQWIPTPNHDNGDLVVAIMNLINSTALLQCSEHITPHVGSDYYDNGLLLCFRLFRGALAQIHRYLPNMKIFFIRESFFRMHLGHQSLLKLELNESSPSSSSSSSSSSSLPLPLSMNSSEVIYQQKDVSCLQNDLIAHGWKQIGTTFWNNLGKCNVADNLKGKGANPTCHWLTVKQEQEIVIKKCYWRSPMCVIMDHQNGTGIQSSPSHSQSQSQSRNFCLESSTCDGEKFNLQRWELCVRYHQCNPSLTYRQFQRRYSLLPLQKPWID